MGLKCFDYINIKLNNFLLKKQLFDEIFLSLNKYVYIFSYKALFNSSSYSSHCNGNQKLVVFQPY